MNPVIAVFHLCCILCVSPLANYTYAHRTFLQYSTKCLLCSRRNFDAVVCSAYVVMEHALFYVYVVH